MQPEQVWRGDAAKSTTARLTRRGVLSRSLRLAGAGALALTVAHAGRGAIVLAQDDSTPEAGAEGEAAGEIQVGTTDDAAAVAGEAAVGAELPAVEGETEADREARRAARDAEEGVGAAVGTVPSTGVGPALGSSLGAVIGAIGLAATAGAAALFTRRPAEAPGDAE